MPRHFRICADTGNKEYDDSSIPFEGICPTCNKTHSGPWITCDNCIAYKEDQDYDQKQAYQDWLDEHEPDVPEPYPIQ